MPRRSTPAADAAAPMPAKRARKTAAHGVAPRRTAASGAPARRQAAASGSGRSSPAEPGTGERAYGGRSSEERRAERRARLVAAGLAVIGDLGYAATTVRAVCQEAQLTERYFYESFDNGEALLGAVYSQLVDGLRASVVAALAAAPPGDPRGLAEAGIAAYFRCNRDPRAARVLLLEILGVSPAVNQLYRRAMDEFAQLVRQIAEPLVTALPASARPADYDMVLIAHGLVGTLVHVAMQWHLSRYRQPLATVTGSAMTIFDAVQSRWLAAEATAPAPTAARKVAAPRPHAQR